jgi:hypothetical protein
LTARPRAEQDLPEALLSAWRAPERILRLELIRFMAPLAILGFMSGRLAHADEWLGAAGFRVPELDAADWRQPLYIPTLPGSTPWFLAALMVASGLALAVGFRVRVASLTFAATLAFVALSDRLAAFTVSKMAPAIALALFFSPAGARYGVDAFLEARKTPRLPRVEEMSSGSFRFLQSLLLVLYASTGACKAKNEWFKTPFVLWTHVHDSYQTTFSWAIANATPVPVWILLQYVVLALELLAPLWFLWKKTRPYALVIALGMHAMIGLMFGPVKWFALLMISLLLGSFLPERVISAVERRLGARLG